MPNAGAHAVMKRFVAERAADVIVTSEAEALLSARADPAAGLEVVTPAATIRIDARIEVPDRVVLRPDARELAAAYVDFLHAPEAQAMFARHFHRPAGPDTGSKVWSGSGTRLPHTMI